MANQNVEIIKGGYAAFNAADPEATMAVSTTTSCGYPRVTV